MKKTALLVCSLGLMLAGGVTTAAQATYQISVSLDEATKEDVGLIESSLTNASQGEAPRALRKLAAGTAGELAIAASQRVDASGLLTLDDGTVVALFENDRVQVTLACNPSGEKCLRPGADVVWGKEGFHHPTTIIIKTPNSCRLLRFSGAKPQIITGSECEATR